jgi:hypothetical protein
MSCEFSIQFSLSHCFLEDTVVITMLSRGLVLWDIRAKSWILFHFPRNFPFFKSCQLIRPMRWQCLFPVLLFESEEAPLVGYSYLFIQHFYSYIHIWRLWQGYKKPSFSYVTFAFAVHSSQFIRIYIFKFVSPEVLTFKWPYVVRIRN